MRDAQAELNTALEKLEATSAPAAAMLADPLSKLTRTRQQWLLGVSLLSILLSRRAIVLKTSTVLGITFSLGAQPLIAAALALISGYWLSVFLASMYQDLTLFAYKVLPSRIQVARMTLLASDASSSAMTRALAAADHHATLMAELEELTRLRYQYMSEDQRERLLKLPAEMQLTAEEVRASELKLDSALNTIIRVYPWQTRLQKVRFTVEALFPTGFGLYAIYLVVW